MSYFYIVRHRAHHDIELPLLQDAELHFTGFMTPYMIPVSVNKTLLLGKPLPCNPEAETALQPLIWHSEGLYFHFLEECFFTDTGMTRAAWYAWRRWLPLPVACITEMRHRGGRRGATPVRWMQHLSLVSPGLPFGMPPVPIVVDLVPPQHR